MEGVTGADGKAVVHELPVFAKDGSFYNFISTVGIIIKERMTDMLHMDADLMGPAGLQYALYEGDISESFQYLIMRDGFFAMVPFGVGVE